MGPGLASWGLQAELTIILFVQTFEHQPQFLLVVLEVMDELFKVQLPIQVFVTSLHNFLEDKIRFCVLAHASAFPWPSRGPSPGSDSTNLRPKTPLSTSMAITAIYSRARATT